MQHKSLGKHYKRKVFKCLLDEILKHGTHVNVLTLLKQMILLLKRFKNASARTVQTCRTILLSPLYTHICNALVGYFSISMNIQTGRNENTLKNAENSHQTPPQRRAPRCLLLRPLVAFFYSPFFTLFSCLIISVRFAYAARILIR